MTTIATTDRSPVGNIPNGISNILLKPSFLASPLKNRNKVSGLSLQIKKHFNQNFKTMKHSYLTLIILLTAIPFCQSVAQTSYNSKRETIGSFNCNKEIVCDHASRYIVTYSHNMSSTPPHYFTVQDMQNNIIKQFPLNIGSASITPTISPITRYEINDMKVGDLNYVYFCGSRQIITVSPTYTSVSVGFIGRFSLTDALGSGGNVEIFFIDGTTAFGKIEPRGSLNQVFAVGSTDVFDIFSNTYYSCLVGLEYNNQSSSWKYDLVEPSNLTERFTDVAFSGGIIVSSRFINNNYLIGIRHTKNGPLCDPENYSLLSNCNLYDMQNVVTPGGVAVAFRKENDPILLASRGGNVTMAHSCYNIASGIAAYEIYLADLGDARISQIRYLPSTNYVTLKNINLSFNHATAFFLANDATAHNDLIPAITWTSTPSLCPTRTISNSSDMKCQGLSRFYKSNYEYIYVGGCGSSSNNPAYYAQRNTSLTSLCLPTPALYFTTNLTVPAYTVNPTMTINNLSCGRAISSTLIQPFTPVAVTPTTTCNY